MAGKSLAPIAMGNQRAEMAANIAMAAFNWERYESDHASLFAQNNLQKTCIVDEKGAIIARNSSAADAVKHALYTNASTLRHEDFLMIQEMITEIRRRKLNGIQDLKDAGLMFPADIADQIVGTENVSGFDDAQQDQNPTGYDNNDTIYEEIYVPNPITHSTFSVPWRQQGFAYKTSAGLKESMRKVAERLEKTLFLGNGAIKVNFNGSNQSIYGYTTHPGRGTSNISDWSSVANNDLIVNEVIALVNTMFSEQGGVEMDSVVLYFPKNFKGAMDRDYKSGFPSKTVADRIKDIPEIRDVKFGEYLPDSEVVLVEMTERTIQLAQASDIVSVPHIKTNPMASQPITTYAAMVQVIKVDSEGNTGIMHATVA